MCFAVMMNWLQDEIQIRCLNKVISVGAWERPLLTQCTVASLSQWIMMLVTARKAAIMAMVDLIAGGPCGCEPVALVKSPETDGGGGVGKQLYINWERIQVVVKEG